MKISIWQKVELSHTNSKCKNWEFFPVLRSSPTQIGLQKVRIMGTPWYEWDIIDASVKLYEKGWLLKPKLRGQQKVPHDSFRNFQKQ